MSATKTKSSKVGFTHDREGQRDAAQFVLMATGVLAFSTIIFMLGLAGVIVLKKPDPPLDFFLNLGGGIAAVLGAVGALASTVALYVFLDGKNKIDYAQANSIPQAPTVPPPVDPASIGGPQ